MASKLIKEIPISHWNMPKRLLDWVPQKPLYWCPKAYVGWAGLGLRFNRNGTVNWMVYYNIPGQPKKIHALGELHPQNFRYQEAEAAGRAIKEAAKRGVDLVATKKVSRDPLGDVREMGERFLMEWSKPRKRTAWRDEHILRDIVFPAIGDMKPHEVEYDHVYPIVRTIADRAPANADLVKAVISKMFNWGVGPYKVKHNPTHGMAAFHVRPKEDDAEYGAVPLTLDQVGKFWHGLDEINVAPVMRWYARFLLLTGVRPVEAAGTYFDELQAYDGRVVWVIPGIRMKKGKAHRVPLSDLALEIVPKERPFVFPSPYNGGKKPLQTNALRDAMRKHADTLGLKPGQSPYSLRKFVATTIGGLCHPGSNIRYDDDDVGLILAHKRGSVTAVYNQEKYDDLKRTMLQQLADEVRKRI